MLTCVDENGRHVQYNLPVYIYVIGDKSLPIHNNKNRGKVNTAEHRKKIDR